MQEVYNNVFMTGIPLTGNPLKELNCYIIKGSKRNLVIDVGFDIPEGREKIETALKELECRPEETDVFITHAHEDHIGALETLYKKGCFSTIYMSGLEVKFYNNLRKEGLRPSTVEMARWEGFSMEEGENAFFLHPGAKLCGGMAPLPFTEVEEGDEISLGDYTFQVILFPGHTMGLAGLYEKKHKILFAGDHILGKITPNIAFWTQEFDALGEYLDSLDRAAGLEVKKLFSAHRQSPPEMISRINELKSHHKKRLKEVAEIIANCDGCNVCEIAGEMHWDFAGGKYEKFPMTQKWFASGEAFAHAEYLYKRKLAEREEKNGVFYYYVSKTYRKS